MLNLVVDSVLLFELVVLECDPVGADSFTQFDLI